MPLEGNPAKGFSGLLKGLCLSRQESWWVRELRGLAIQSLLKLPSPTAPLVSPEGFLMSAQRFGGQEQIPNL